MRKIKSAPLPFSIVDEMFNIFYLRAQLSRLSDPRFYTRVSADSMKVLARRMWQQLGTLSDWSFIQQSILLPYIINMPPKVLKSDLTPTMVSLLIIYYLLIN